MRVEAGTHQVQCSKPAGLEGYSWNGLCTVQDYENKQVPVYGTRTVQKSREVTRSLTYPVAVHAPEASAAVSVDGGRASTGGGAAC